MSNIPAELKYTKEHEWVKVEGDVVTVGITDHAQSALGELVYVELPEKGKKVKNGDMFAVVESVKTASEVYAPLAGEVIEVNSNLTASPNLVNDSPYGDGWICKIKLADKGELSTLLSADDYKGLTE